MSWDLQDISLLGKYASRWNDLATAQAGHPFLNIELVERACKLFGDRLFLAIYEENAIVLAMAIIKRKNAWTTETFAPSQLPFALLVADPGIALERCIHDLARTCPLPTLVFSLMHVDDRYLKLDTQTAGLNTAAYAETISIESSGGFQVYASSRSKKLRDNIKRYQKRLKATFTDVQLRVVTDELDMQELVEQHGALEARGWKGLEGSALTQQSNQTQFYTQTLQRFGRTGGAVGYQLLCDEQVVASRFGIMSNGILVFLKTAYSEEHRRLAPGRVLQWLAIEHALDHLNPHTIEFYTKADADQLQWGTSRRMIMHAEVSRTRLIARSIGVARSVRRAIKMRTQRPTPSEPPE